MSSGRAQLEFRILGPLDVREDGHLVELRRHKQRALLAILLLHANEWLSADALIEALWGERPPRTARAALQGYIAQLRRTMGRELIVSREGGYRLEIDPEQLDLQRFEDLVERARRAEPKERLERLREALALWRGPPLADLLYEPFADGEAARLDDRRTAALEELTEAELLLGAGPTLLERLEALIGEHPYRERLRGQLMLALYRSGRQVEALECYGEARHALVDELGVEPGAALRELQQLILLQDESLEPEQAELQAALPAAERRKTVTVVYVELAVAKGLDPELLRNHLSPALRKARAVLERHGATTEQWGSDELLAVFGLPLAHEDDPLRAARAALELQVVVEAIDLRVGVESGEVIAGIDAAGHGFFAGTVVAAARQLLESASPGVVLVGDATQRLLGAQAVTEPPAASAPPTARMLVRVEAQVVPESPFVDRLDERAALTEIFADVARQRRSRLVLLLGEAGIGKTRLAGELCARLDERATVARGRCLSYGQGLTYWPLVEALRELGEPAAEALDQLTAGGATSPQQLAWRVAHTLEEVAIARPLLVLMDDLHWAEQALLELLELVIAFSPEAPILLLCLTRPELLERHPDWEQQECVRLEPLSRPDAETLLAAIPEPLAVDERQRVLARGAGNPLFLEELSAFVATGRHGAELPPRIQVLLQARLDLLPEPQRLLLATAALEGTVFHRGALEALLPEERRAGLARDLSALGQALLVRPASPELELEHEHAYRFRHQLIRDTAYAALPKGERARLHECFADWLAHHGGSRAELADIGAYHLEQAAQTRRELERADPALDARAGEALAAAGERARLRTDLRAAAGLWRRALALLAEDDGRVPELELELGLVLAPLGEPEESRRLLEHIQASAADAGLAAEARVVELEAALNYDPEGAPSAIRRECAQAIPLFEQRRDHRALAHAWFALGGAEQVEGQNERAAEAWRTGAHHAQAAGDHAFAATLLNYRAGFLAATRIPYPDAVREYQRLVELFPGDLMAECGLLFYRSIDAGQRGQRNEARLLRRESLAKARQAGFLLFAGVWRVASGLQELYWGEVVEAERLVLAGIRELESHGERGHLSFAKAVLAEIRIAQGRLGEALELADEAEQLGGPSDRSTLTAAGCIRARAYVRLGDIERAVAAATAAVSIADSTDSIAEQAGAQLALAEALAAADELTRALAAALEAHRLWTTLDRKLLGARTAALIEQLGHAMGAAGAPA